MNVEAKQSPPEWALQPVTAWIYLALSIALALTPVFPLTWVLAIIAAVFTYQDRRDNNLPAFWWTAGVVVFGALAYLFFVYKRPRQPVVYSPEASITQQARLVKGLPPTPSANSQVEATARADWYPDPTGQARLRYWDGAQWTDHTAA